MKVGILTQPLWGNYGGILQNYALQKILRQMGHDPITLDFQAGYSGFTWAIMQIRRIAAKALGRDGSWWIRYAPLRSNQLVNNFIEKHINRTYIFWNKYSKTLITQYLLDAIIVGSDQVWRPCYNQKLEDSFLGFTEGYEIRRIAYAASFGEEKLVYNRSQIKMAKRLINKFDAVSVREKSGVKLVSELGSIASHVLDPTLLLGRDGFDKLAVSPQKSDYLGYYILDNSEEIIAEIKRIQKIANLGDICGLTENTIDCGPEEWIGIIKKSKIFLTDSFHGTVFCILFHIPFYTIINSRRGADRFFSLLSPLGLDNRLVNSLEEITTPKTDINWVEIDKVISLQRDESMSFLSEALCNIDSNAI